MCVAVAQTHPTLLYSSRQFSYVFDENLYVDCFPDCQYTCHLNCVPSVTLDCTTVSPGSGEGPVATPTDLPSPTGSAETSLIERRTVVTHRSPDKLQQSTSSHSGPAAPTAPPTVQHLAPPGGVSGRLSPSQNVSVRDPLSGAYVSQTVSSSSSGFSSAASSSASSVCVERDLNQNAKNVGDVLPELRPVEDSCDATNVSRIIPLIDKTGRKTESSSSSLLLRSLAISLGFTMFG